MQLDVGFATVGTPDMWLLPFLLRATPRLDLTGWSLRSEVNHDSDRAFERHTRPDPERYETRNALAQHHLSGQSAPVTITVVEFVDLLTESCPETVPIVAEHLVDNGNELLLHLLIADVRRFSIEQFERDDSEALSRCLDVVAQGLIEGDEYVENAVAVSFVEDTGWWDPLMQPFIASWPLPLREEAERQRRAWPGNA